jgi:hypothetical protein
MQNRTIDGMEYLYFESGDYAALGVYFFRWSNQNCIFRTSMTKVDGHFLNNANFDAGLLPEYPLALPLALLENWT